MIHTTVFQKLVFISFISFLFSQQAQQKQADFLSGEFDTVPLIGAEDMSNYYILQTREKLGIYV